MKPCTLIICIFSLLLIVVCHPIHAMATATLFGPVNYEKSGYGPTVYTDSFTISGRSGAGKLILTNHGKKQRQRMRFAKIWLNGDLIFKPYDFKGFPTLLKADVNLQETNRIKVKLWGIKGKQLGIEILQDEAIHPTPGPSQSAWIWLAEEGQQPELQFATQKLSHQNFNFKANIPGLQVRHKVVEQQVYSELQPLGGRIMGRLGQPGLPGFSRFVAVPAGAKLQVTVKEGDPVILNDFLLHPVQPAYDLETGPEPFEMDHEAYKKDNLYPVDLVTVGYDWIRGCKIARINVSAARYNPGRKTLVCYPEIEVEIDFIDGSETYIPLKNRSRFFEEIYGELLGNYSITQKDIVDIIHVGTFSSRCDLLIITPIAFEAHARRLADWKEEKGFLTRVATLDDIEASQGGNTADDIRTYIQGVYQSANLSYVLLVGDAEFIPVHYRNIHPTHGIPLGTDLYYAEMDDEGYFPDMGVGRLSVDTEGQAEVVINKIIDYEQNPPFSNDFYNRILHISYFEDFTSRTSDLMVSDGRDENTFVQSIEEIRNFFLFEGDYGFLPRQYATDKRHWPEDGTPEAEGFNGPEWYKDGSPLSDDLLYPGFAWDGNAEGITHEIDAGAFLVIYIGHGKSWGWSKPFYPCEWQYAAPEYPLSRLTNGNLTPVTLSFACRTGWFDQETDIDAESIRLGNEDDESFAEEFLRMNGGSVAVVASSRNSRGGLNEDMAKAFIDGIWDNMIPGYPSADWPPRDYELSRRLGDVLNYSKFYLAEQHGRPEDPFQDYGHSGVLFEGFHLFGDPTMELWVSNPEPLVDLPRMRRIPMRPLEPLWIRFEVPIAIDGVVATLMRKGQILGQGISWGGQAIVQLDEPLTNARRCVISLSKQGYLTKSWPVSLSRPRRFGPKAGLKGPIQMKQ